MRRRPGLDGIPARLWRLVSLARHRLLMLDYDGMLAPFTAARHAATPLPRSLTLVRRIAACRDTSVAIMTGRPSGEIERLAGSVPGVVVGEHGWERKAPERNVVRAPLDPVVVATVERADREARSSGWGDLIDRKRTAVVLHTRSLSRARARVLKERCVEAGQALTRTGHVRLDPIDGGVELRARGRNKGTAALSLMSQALPGTLGVFVGDDVSDEEALYLVRDRGFGVRMRGRRQAFARDGTDPVLRRCSRLPRGSARGAPPGRPVGVMEPRRRSRCRCARWECWSAVSTASPSASG